MGDVNKTDVEYVETLPKGELKQAGIKGSLFKGSDELKEAILRSPPQPKHRQMLILYFMTAIISLTATMSGYDGSVMSALMVMKPFQKEFGSQVDGVKAAYISAMYQIGSVCAIPFISHALDRFGRRIGVFTGCTLVVIGTIIQGTSGKTGLLGQFLAGRVIVGFAVALCTACGPVYAIELSHPDYRGIMGALVNPSWFWGSILASGVTRATSTLLDNSSWLIPVWVQMIFPGIIALFVLWFPESPRWLYTHGRSEEAKAFLVRYHGLGDPNNDFVQLQISEFEAQLEINGSDKRWWDYRPLFNTRAARYRMFCSMAMTAWGQLTSGGLSYFIGALFASAGITNTVTVLDYNLGVAITNAGGAYTGAMFADRIGRRRLLLTSLSASFTMWIGLSATIGCYETLGSRVASKIGIACYFMHSFGGAFGITPMQGLYITEVLAFEQRGKGMAVSNFVSNATALFNQFVVPVALANIGWKTYLIYTCWVGFVEIPVTYFFFVETKGYTLEELDVVFSAENPREASTQRRTIMSAVTNDGTASEDVIAAV